MHEWQQNLTQIINQKDWKSRLRWEKGRIFHKFAVRNSGAWSGDVRKLRVSYWYFSLGMPIFAIIRQIIKIVFMDLMIGKRQNAQKDLIGATKE